MNALAQNKRLLYVLVAAGGVAVANAQTLTWDPIGTPVWDSIALNWMDGGTRTAWVPGAVATFNGVGGFVNVAADVEVSGITFASGGYTLAGYGRIRLEGALDVVAGVTNSVGTELFSSGGVTKTGAGAVALGKCVGRVSVAAGDLLAVSSALADAQVSVGAGGRIVTAGEPARGMANLVVNGGFEAYSVAGSANRFEIASPENLPGWGVVADNVRVQNVDGENSAWSSADVAPEGVQTLILQMGGSVKQTVTVAAAGWYQVAFDYFLRRNNPPETLLYATLDGVPIAGIVNDAHELFPKRYVSVPFWLAPGEYLLGLAGDGNVGDRTSLIDDVVFAPAFAVTEGCPALGGDSRVTLLNGAEAVLNHSGSLGVARLDVSNGSVVGPGAWGETMAGNWFDYAGGVWTPPLVMGEEALLRVQGPGTLALQGEARRVWVSGGAEITGTGLALTNAEPAKLSQFSVTDTSAVRVTAPLALRNRAVFDVSGSLTIEDTFAMTNTQASKRGPGEMSFLQPLGLGQPLHVIDGKVKLAFVGAQTAQMGDVGTGYVFALPLPGRTAEVCLTQPGLTNSLGVAFGGGGRSVFSTALGGGFVAAGHPRTLLETPVEFDVPGGDMLAIKQLLVWNTGMDKGGGFLKAGAGTLEIREAAYDGGNNRAHQGRVILRNGTLRVLVDDTGPYNGLLAYNGSTWDGRGGSLGRGPLTDAVWVGDAGTLPTDNLTFTAVGNKRYIGHDFEIFNVGNDVRFEVEDSTDTMFEGTFTLHRGMTFAGAPGAHLILGGVVADGAADLVLEGFGRVTILNGLSGDINLDMGGRELVLCPDAVTASTLESFAMGNGGAIHVCVEVGEPSSIHAQGAVTLGAVAFNLYYSGTVIPFNEPGTYTLMTAATLNANPLNLSVATAMPGFTYTFNNAGGALTLTIDGTVPGALTSWKSKEGGAWGTGSNWDPATVPDSSAVSVQMGTMLTNDATVTLGAPFTVRDLTFSHPNWSYTLEGAPLTLGGRLDVIIGSHTIKNTLDAAGPLSAAVANGALRFDGTGGVLPQVLLEPGGGTLELAGESSLAGGVEVADGATLAVSGPDTTIGTSLVGAPGGGLTFQAGGKLTVSQSAGGVFSGNLQGPASAEIVKGGAGTWTLDGCGSIYEGTFYQTGGAGQTTLEGVSILGGIRVDTGTAVAFDPPASDGLMGYYYIGNPTASSNSFLTLAGMEAYFAGRRPALIRPSGLDGPNFDYTGAADFPYPFGHGGPNPTEFSAVWRGSITVPETGTYSFGAWVDDFTLLAIDGTVLHAANSYIATFVFSTIDLTAGRHDFLFAMGQGAGGVIARLQVCLPSQTVHQALPNSWFSPMPTVGALDAAGPVALHGNANVSVGLRGVGSLSGGLSVGAGGLFEKSGEGTFDLGGGSANQILGDMSVLGGVLNILPPNLLGAQNYLTLYDGAMFRTEEPQTVAGLRGKGGIAVLGNGADVFAFTDETDCGISTEKNYTHLVNFPLSPSAFSTVNGVTFDTGDAGWSWGAGIPPPFSLGNSTEDGVAGLLGGFLYNSQNYTIRLTGLAPLTAHEFRFYFRNYGTLGSPRNVAFTFSVGGAAVGTARHNLDGMTRSQVRCRYVTDAAGTLDVRVLSLNPDMCHLYAFSNEDLGTAGSGATGPVLTVMSPAGADTRYEGSLGGPGALVKDGPGIQRFGSAISLEGGLTVLAGEAVLASGANLKGTTEVAAGAALSAPYGAVTLSGLSGGGTFHMGGAGNFMPNWIYLHPITNDVSSLISPTKVYTHKLDFGSRVGTTIGGPGATVNGVEFVKAGPGGSSGSYGWSGFQTGTNPGGTPAGIASDQGMHALLTDMVNANNTPGNPQIATLTGLTPGKQYEIRFYNRAWTADAARYQTVTFMPGGSVSDTVNFNVDGLTPHFLAYRYTPVSSELTISIDGHGSNESWHIYALTNEEYDGQDDEECLLHGITPGVPYTATYPVETLYQHFFTDDATSQISPLKCYTHALDFGSRGGMPLSLPGAVVNGVQFTKAGSNGAMNGYGWTGFGNANNVGKGGNTGTTSDQGVYGLLTDFVFNQATGTARLTGLIPGKQYEVRIYLRAWNLNGNRPITLNFSADPAVTHSISFMEDNIPTRFVAYRYTPTSTTLTIQYNALSGDTWHIYALTNEEANDQTTSPVVLDTAEDAVFSGTVTGHGMWVKRGAGALTMTGVNTATGPLTVDGGAFGVGADGIATLGPVSVQGGMLFGQGTVGGAVHVAPGVWIQGGTADACGTLTTGGDLVIEEGVNIKYRYASSSVADTFIVNGVLTLPNDGVIYTQPFTVGARPPAKWLLFDSPNAINGPADLSGWVVDGIPSAKLTYGPGKTRVYLNAPRGTMLLIR